MLGLGSLRKRGLGVRPTSWILGLSFLLVQIGLLGSNDRDLTPSYRVLEDTATLSITCSRQT